MPTYVCLINWTDQGVRSFKDSVDRYEAAKSAVSGLGVSFKDIYWTVGPHDIVSIVEAPDDETARAFSWRSPPRATSGRRRCAPSAPTRCGR